MSVRDCVELERSKLLIHAVNSDEKLLNAESEKMQLKTRLKQRNKVQRKKERKKSWKEKKLQGEFLRETKELKEETRWQLLKAGVLKRET